MHGDSVEELIHTINKGVPGTSMEAFSGELSETQIRTLAIFIGEERAQTTFADFRVSAPLEVPSGSQSSELHDFHLDTVVEDLDPLPYSIAPLPDGRILLTEKMRGLTIISADGSSPASSPAHQRATTTPPSAAFCGWAMVGSWMSRLIPTSRTTAGSISPTAIAAAIATRSVGAAGSLLCRWSS